MKRNYLCTAREASCGTERDLSGDIDPIYQAMSDRCAARAEAKAERMASLLRRIEREAALTAYEATMPERETRLAAVAAYRAEAAGLTAEKIGAAA